MKDYLTRGVKRYLMYCPHCGCSRISAQEKTYYNRLHEPEKSYWYQCNNCGARSGEFPSRDKAAEAWNRRFAQ